MSEKTNIFYLVKQEILQKFEAILTAVKQRQETLINNLELIRAVYNSKQESKLNTLQELEQMRSQMAAMYIRQNRAAQVQEAALRPINEEIGAIKVTLSDPDYKLMFQLDTLDITGIIESLGALVESEYGSLENPPAVPPRTPNLSRSSSPNLSFAEKHISIPNIESIDLYPKQNVSRSYSHEKQPLNLHEYEEIEFATVIPRSVSNTPVSDKPPVPYRTSISSNKSKPIFSTCERGDEEQNIRSPKGLAYHYREGHIYIVDHGLHKILVVSDNGEFVCEFGQNVLERPVSIAICEDFCYICDEALNAVVKYRLSDYTLVASRRYRVGAKFGEMSLPRGLDSDSREFLFIADSGNNRVCMLDSSLLFVKLLFEGILESPQDVKIIDNNIYVLDRNPLSCLHSFTRAGIPIQSVISIGHTLPSFFCSDFYGNIMISDHVSIRVFSLDGAPICTVGEQLRVWDNGVSEPMGLCATRDNKVVCAYSRGENALCFY